jgi:excisionase family DNA binding protein
MMLASTPLPSARARSRDDLSALSPPSAPLAISPREACRLLQVGMSFIYGLMRTGELEAFHAGRVRRITRQSLEAYITRRLADPGPPPPHPFRDRRGRLQSRKRA